jgi:hypothetical protein
MVPFASGRCFVVKPNQVCRKSMVAAASSPQGAELKTAAWNRHHGVLHQLQRLQRISADQRRDPRRFTPVAACADRRRFQLRFSLVVLTKEYSTVNKAVFDGFLGCHETVAVHRAFVRILALIRCPRNDAVSRQCPRAVLRSCPSERLAGDHPVAPISDPSQSQQTFHRKSRPRWLAASRTGAIGLPHRLNQIGDQTEGAGHQVVELMVQHQAGMGVAAFAERGREQSAL